MNQRHVDRERLDPNSKENTIKGRDRRFDSIWAIIKCESGPCKPCIFPLEFKLEKQSKILWARQEIQFPQLDSHLYSASTADSENSSKFAIRLNYLSYIDWGMTKQS